MGRRRIPARKDGIVLSEHRRPDGSLTFARCLHMLPGGGADLIDWMPGDRLPSEWTRLSKADLDALALALGVRRP